jgi:WD40 repeat protein/energy-coupling factor transporter ATP-binding protein EcfA2
MVNYSVQVDEQQDESAALPISDKLTQNPFPGLRHFSMDEYHLFFGRETHIEEILLKISQNRSVAILGYSGSGKSSLTYSGLIPMLYGGFMTETSPHWKVVVTRPGSAPIRNLADSIVKLLLEEGRVVEGDIRIQKAVINSVLRNSSNGLVEVTRYIQTHLRENVFFLFDQFEELFRYRHTENTEDDNEALEFVNLVLNVANQRSVPSYVAINMRADYMGNCSVFPGLTEFINTSTYLVPQLTREQKRKVIEGPVAVGGGRISQRLVKRLLSDIGDNQDQLPLLQHALMRTWDYWVANREPDEPMDIRHYNAIGQLSQALSLHADEAFDELNAQDREIAEILFKSITEKNQENLGVRRQAKVSLVAGLAGVSDSQVINVVEKFRQVGRSFLMPAYSVALNADSLIELSHESLIRIWTRLAGWVDEEFESARMYKRVSDAAAMYQIGKTGLWRPPDLQLALNWQKKQNPTRAWAERYDIAFERAIVFLDTSRITFEAELKNQEMLQRRMLRRARVTNIVLAIALVISIGLFFYGLTQSIEAVKQADKAKTEAEKAKRAQKKAESASQELLKQTKELRKKDVQLRNSVTKLSSALEQTNRARNEAAREAENAKRQEQNAKKQTEIANIKSDSLKIKSDEANRNLEKANILFYLALARSLEAKSENIDNQQLAGLIAMQGYNYHQKYRGNQYDPYVFRGLYYALTKLRGTNYNALKVPTANNKLFALAVSKKSETFYTSGNDGRVIIGDFLRMNSKPTPYKNTGYTNQVLALSKDEKYLAVGNDSSIVEVINLQSNEKPLQVKGHQGSITDIKFMPDNSGFVSVSSGGTLRFMKQNESKSYEMLSLPFSLKSIDISSDSRWIAAASVEGKLILINMKDYSYREIANETPNRILSVAFNPIRTNLLAYGMEVISQRKVVRGIVKMIDIETNKTKELSGHKAGVADLKFSPDGKLLASAGLDKKLQMWVVDHEEDLPIVMDNNNGNVWRIDFANGSDYLLGSCNNGEIRVWPTNIKMLADQLCPLLSRNITKEEWRTYIGDEKEIKYQETCAKSND